MSERNFSVDESIASGRALKAALISLVRAADAWAEGDGSATLAKGYLDALDAARSLIDNPQQDREDCTCPALITGGDPNCPVHTPEQGGEAK